ncbi:hypothetical protein U9M48_021071 [Paspalum notatum var. saurae]|uniref:Uncharacterized protein n=1 Tax=Paspalum notatum var. saurae TaxID=547442 RepID=A0AAQ3TGK7_PASNO
MLLQAHAVAEELSVERDHLLAELEFQQLGRREREEIFRIRFQQVWRDEEHSEKVEKAEAAVLVADKELHVDCYEKLLELAASDFCDFKNCISNLAAENIELKAKLKKVEVQAEHNENNDNAKELRAEVRKLKQAYKALKSEKDKEILALEREKKFVWNQFNTKEQEAKKLQKSLDELQVIAQKKDDEMVNVQVELINAKERMLILEDELQKMRSLVKDKEDRPDTNQKLKKSESSVLYEKSRTSEDTPEKREARTSRTRASEASQKRKRGSMSLGSRQCSTRPLQIKAAASPSPMLLPPGFTVPRLKTPTPKCDALA